MTFLGGTGGFANDATIISGVPCEVAADVGDWVRMDGGIAIRASADVFDNSNVIGIIESKDSATICTIRFLGLSVIIFTGLDETKEYFLSALTPGKMETFPPTAPGQVLLKIGQPLSDMQFVVIKGTRILRS